MEINTIRTLKHDVGKQYLEKKQENNHCCINWPKKFKLEIMKGNWCKLHVTSLQEFLGEYCYITNFRMKVTILNGVPPN